MRACGATADRPAAASTPASTAHLCTAAFCLHSHSWQPTSSCNFIARLTAAPGRA